MPQSGLQPTEPLPIWDRPIEVNLSGFFKAIAKGVVMGTAGKWEEAAKEAVDAAGSLGLGLTPGEVAWVLIHRAATRAVVELAIDCKEAFSPQIDVVGMSEDFDTDLMNESFAIGPDFFDNPARSSFLPKIESSLSDWLRNAEISESRATAAAKRLPSYFIFALHNEWRSRPSDYAIVQQSLTSPFARATARESGWAQYYSWLKKQVDQRMFDELFSLRQVFVEPRAYFEEKLEKAAESFEIQTHLSVRKVVDLREELTSWLRTTDPRSCLRIISGGPGSGKSSFAKMFASRLAEDRLIPVVFIPLHRFDYSGDLIDAIESFVRIEGLLSHNPLTPGEEDKVLVIFDGLDELAMQGKLGAEVAQSFLREIDRKLAQYNGAGAIRLLALVIGRELVIQANAREFRREGQVLHILPYFHSGDLDDVRWDDSGKLLQADQRDRWWGLYGEASGLGYKCLPKELSRKDLNDVTGQPLLNYLVALGHARKRLDFSKNFNLNLMYEDLLQSVHDRGWAGHQHVAIGNLSYKEFVRILEEVALCSWHGTGRTTTVAEISLRCSGAGLGKLLDEFKDGAKSGVTRLLTAFYFRQVGQGGDGEHTFEFTHKSFSEYLTARRIVRGIDKALLMLGRRKDNPDDGWDQLDALQELGGLLCQSKIDGYLAEFIRREVILRGKEATLGYQDALAELFRWGVTLKGGHAA